MKLKIPLLKSCVFLFSISFIISCTSSPSLPQNDVIIGIANTPTTLDPRRATDAQGMRIASLLFQSLVKIDKQLQVQAMAATSWSYKNKAYTFIVPKHWTFSNGRHFKKEDIIFSFNEFRSRRSPFYSAFSLIQNVSVTEQPSQFSVKIMLKSDSATFLNSDLPVIKILPKQETLQLKDQFKDHPIGSGAFTLLSYSSNQIVLKPRFKTSFKKVIFKIIRDDLTRFQKILKNEVHIIQSDLPYPKVHYLKTLNIPYRIIEKDGLSMNYILLNLKDPLLRNLKVRQAIFHAINRKDLIQYKLKGFASPALSILNKDNPFYNPKLSPFIFRPQKAKSTLDSLGFNSTPLQIKTSNNKSVISYAKVIAHYLRQVGLKVQLLSMEWGTFYGHLNQGRFQSALLRWVGAYDPDIFRIAFHSKEHPPYGRNRGSYKNKEIDTLLTKGKVTLDIKKRKKIYDKIQAVLLQELPIIPLWHNKQVAIVSNDIEGYELYSNGSFDFLMSISLKKN